MKHLSVALALCCSLNAVNMALAEGTRMPWVDRSDSPLETMPEFQEVKPVPEMQFQRPADKAWMSEVPERLKKSIPVEENMPVGHEIQVFISRGIPEGSLRLLFDQATTFAPGKVRFVLRGFEPQKLGELLSEIRGMLPDPMADDVLIEIDPNAFRDYKIDTVPVFLVKERDKWFEVKGLISLEGAKEHVRRRGTLVAGESYPITEPDILAVIQERAKNYDWSAAMKRAQGRMAKNLSRAFDLPTVVEKSEEMFEPVFTVPEDINVPENDGKTSKLLARKGDRFNVLDFTRLQVPIIVFDPNDPRQGKMVQKWLKDEFKNADVFFVGGIDPVDGRPAQSILGEKLKRPIYPWIGRMTDRFGVRAVPAIVEQIDRQLRVRYFEPRMP